MRNIIIDFDNTLVNSSETALQISGLLKDKKFDSNLLEWGFTPYASTDEERNKCLKIFSDDSFYERLQLYPGCKQALNYLSNSYSLILCSKRPENGYDKCIKYMKDAKIYDYFSNIVFVDNFDKSIVGSSNDIIIDDKIETLLGNRYLKILFGNFKYQVTDMMEILASDDNTYLDIFSSMIHISDWDSITKEIISKENN